MSGHSKWASIKHQKAAKDKTRGKLFAKLIRQVEVAAREGGGDLEANATLRTMYAKARAASVPTDTIERAIKRGTGELEGATYEAITYEGYAPCGVAVMVDALTDNRNRTGSDIRNVFAKLGGSMAEPGAVSWQFSRRGVITAPKTYAEDDVMLAAAEAGADDVIDEGESWRITCDPAATESVRAALESAGISVESADSTLLASTSVPVTNVEDARRLLRLFDTLEENDDVSEVYSNVDIPDDVLSAVSV